MVIIRRRVPRDPTRVQQDMEQIFRAMLRPRAQLSPRPLQPWRPPVEVYETEEALVVVVEIAGIDAQHLEVALEEDLLSICGERRDDRHCERRTFREAGIAYGPFSIEVFVPFAVDPDGAEADYTNGLLRIRLPRAIPTTIFPRRRSDSAARD